MDEVNPILRKVIEDTVGQYKALMSIPGGERERYAVILGRRLAGAAGMLREDGVIHTLAGMRVIINEYTASVEVVREG